MALSKELVEKAKHLDGLLEKYKQQITKVLPKQIDIHRFARVAFNTALKNPYALEDPNAFLQCVMQAAVLGLEIDDVRGQAYIIPFYDSKAGRNKAQFIPGYKGLIDLAQRSGQVLQIDAFLVYENEQYSYTAGLEAKITHSPLPPSERGEKIIAGYATAHLKGGGIKFIWLWEEEMTNVRDKSQGYRSFISKKARSSVWVDWPEIMRLKTCIRYLAKFLPQSPELQKAVSYDEAAERGEPIKDFFFGDDTQGEIAARLEEGVQKRADADLEALKSKTEGKIAALLSESQNETTIKQGE